MNMSYYERRLRERGLSEEEIRDSVDEFSDDLRRDTQDRELEAAHWHDSTGDEE